MSWTKLPPVEQPGLRSGCLTCGPQPVVIHLLAPLCVGFGSVSVTRDGAHVWDGDDEEMLVANAEQWASEDPDHDWRIFFFGPLSDAEYQRHGAGEWVLVKKGPGFA